MGVPANALSILKIMRPVAMFDLLKPLGIFEWIFPDSIDDAEQFESLFTEQSVSLGYDSFNIYIILGTVMIIFWIMAI